MEEARLNYDLLAKINGIPEFSNLIQYYNELSEYDRELTPRFKSDLKGETYGIDEGFRWDDCVENGEITLNEGMMTECKITDNGNGTYHCASNYLGNFDYNPEEWAIGYKEVPETSDENGDPLKIPVAKCVKDDLSEKSNEKHRTQKVMPGMQGTTERTSGNETIHIPEGIKNLDYSFEGRDDINFIPRLPDSVESAHCSFKGCTNLYQESWQAIEEGFFYDPTNFAFDCHMKWPENLQDMSGMFEGCTNLNNLSVDKLPKNLLTVNGAFADCPKLFEGEETWFLGLLKMDNWQYGSNKILYDDSMYLTESFSNATNSETNNLFKLENDKAKAKLPKLQEEFANGDLTAEQSEMLSNAKAGETSAVTQSIYAGESLAGNPEDKGMEIEENKFGAGIQSAVMSVLGGVGIKLVVGDITGSGILGTIAGIGGGFLLNKSGLLDNMLEPVVAFAEDMVPEGATKDMLSGFKDKIHTPTNEERTRAEEQRLADYAHEGISKVYSGMLKAPTGNLHDCMYNSAYDLMKYKSYYYAAEEETGTSIRNLSKLSQHAINTVEGKVDNPDEKNEYYTQMLDGLAASNEGANAALNEMYPADSAEREQAYRGLLMANDAATTPIVEAMIKDGLFTEETRAFISSNIPGVNIEEIERNMGEKTTATSPTISLNQINKNRKVSSATENTDKTSEKPENTTNKNEKENSREQVVVLE